MSEEDRRKTLDDLSIELGRRQRSREREKESLDEISQQLDDLIKKDTKERD